MATWQELKPKLNEALVDAFIATPLPTVNPTPACYYSYQSMTTEDTFSRLIQAEHVAVNTENLEIIQAIFASDAVVVNAQSGETWTDVVGRYQKLFEEVDYDNATHFEIKAVGPGIRSNVTYFAIGLGIMFWGFSAKSSLVVARKTPNLFLNIYSTPNLRAEGLL